MAENGYHRGGFVHLEPRPLIRAVDGETIDRMNEGAVAVTVTVDDVAMADSRIEHQVRAAMGVPRRLLGRDRSR